VLRETDILWTKPSELSFYCALGIPIIMTPPIGSQERFNRQWLFEMQAGIKQETPEYTNEWLFDRLNDGLFAEMAWSGFLKARKLGTYKIIEVLREGRMTRDPSPVIR
jgi:UDP-N-acetylglucosamine:LPS N-acetylglucosamine transferase